MVSNGARARQSLVNALAAYRRPGTPVYAYHFRNLPKEVLQQENAAAPRAILQDDSLPPRVREHAAGALGELRDQCAVGMLTEALGRAKLRRGATKMGLAVADTPTGPYLKCPANPVLGSGHEVCVWPHGHGVGCLVCRVGQQGNSLQYSDDGVHFQKIVDTVPPKAPGPFRADGFVDGQGPGVTWGISMEHGPERPYLVRFECDLRDTGTAPLPSEQTTKGGR